jgi:N-methylhydantoinase B
VTAEGDLYSLTACNELGGQALNEMLDDFKLADLTDEARFIIERSRQAMIREISALPDGEYDHEMVIDGYREPVRLKARLRIHGERLSVDFAGSSSRSEAGINVPLPYTEAYASFGVRCIVGNEVPNNAGSLAAITVTAPEGSILNAPRPSAVSARHSVGQMLPDVVLGCLAQVVPEKVPAEGASCIWNPVFMNAPGATAANLSATPFVSNPIFNGGTGARAVKDGLSTTAFPSGVRTTSTEINEATTPLVIWRKEYRPDSGGPGTRRGGLGQTIELGHREGAAFVISKMFDRILHPARGRFGGGDGMSGSVHIKAGAVLPGKGRDFIPAGETLVLETPGGGGIGPVNERPREAVRADLSAGLISREAATAVYGYSEGSSEDSDEELRFPADSGK